MSAHADSPVAKTIPTSVRLCSTRPNNMARLRPNRSTRGPTTDTATSVAIELRLKSSVTSVSGTFSRSRMKMVRNGQTMLLPMPLINRAKMRIQNWRGYAALVRRRR